MALKCMFDTNVFNRVRDGKLLLSSVSGSVEPYATHIQFDELNNTRNPVRRQALIETFRQVISATISTGSFVTDASRLDEATLSEERVVPTSSGVWGVSRYGQCTYSGPESFYTVIRADLDALNDTSPNNVQDALIADTAIRGGYVLVTDDGDLAMVTRNHGGACLSVSELLALRQ